MTASIDEHVLAGVAVAQRARAAGIVADHAADGGARGGRDVDREPEAVRLEPAVELVEHDAGLDHAALAGDVELDQVVEIARAVDHQRGVDGLAGLRGAGAARQYADALLARERERVLGFFHRARRHHAERHDLVVRGVGGVAPAREGVELHLAQKLRLEPPLQAGHQRFGHTATTSKSSCADLSRASSLVQLGRRGWHSGLHEYRNATSRDPPHALPAGRVQRCGARSFPRLGRAGLSAVMPVHVVPGVHVLCAAAKAWMAGRSPAMTNEQRTR